MKNCLPSQQSAWGLQLLPVVEKSTLQLLFPQVKSPVQSASRSQSPPPMSHGLALEQQAQSVYGIPLQGGGGGGVVGGGVVGGGAVCNI